MSKGMEIEVIELWSETPTYLVCGVKCSGDAIEAIKARGIVADKITATMISPTVARVVVSCDPAILQEVKQAQLTTPPYPAP